MKKLILLLLADLFILTICFAEKYPFIDNKYISSPDEFYYFGENKFEIQEYDSEGNLVVHSYECRYVEKEAYLVAKIKNADETKELYIFCADKEHVIFYNKSNGSITACSRFIGHRDEPWIWSAFDISSTSALSENLNGQIINYPAENLKISLLNKSWVEGVKGSGIGEAVSFSNCGKGSRRIYFINGFFSPEKPSLFYDNNRVKKLKINCYDEYGKLTDVVEKTVADTGHMQIIDFNERYSKFDFIIEEVYPGRKYDDTAITGIFLDALDLYRK